ncbi:MAG: hypothetical protein KAV87_09360 [Desulfobacteraceae bacterium]|nr:hypothetical protein [Desulfobacteraceae bacterium]
MVLKGPDTTSEKEKTKRFIRKNQDPYLIISRIKLWPSRKGILHGVRSVKREGNVMAVITHCSRKARVKCSKNGRLARWLRNKWYEKACPYCRVPGWKLQKYSQTSFIKEKKYD